MGRRSLIPYRTIQSLISSYNSARRREEQNNIIAANSSKQKELPPQYRIVSQDFNETSRVLHIIFCETKKYRKIERYVTQDYVRYPVYSQWCQKEKQIKKTIKLTNKELETLNTNPDSLIREFSFEIVERLSNENLIPSWFIIKLLNNEKNNTLKWNNEFLKNFRDKCNSEIKKNQKAIYSLESQKSKMLVEKHNINEKIETLEKKIKNCCKTSNWEILFAILSFGIYAIIHSNSRKERLSSKLLVQESTRDEIENNISKLNCEIENNKREISKWQQLIVSKQNETEKANAAIIEKINKDISLVEPLMVEIESDTGFIPLKKLIGIPYEKIIGCYVIRNIEKDKYYVGQSKDVIKRVTKDHFNGTGVRNIIFAEDYYTSTLEDKSNLFEVKIIRLSTKDELDKKEKELIEMYDAFNSGYNGTSGNT